MCMCPASNTIARYRHIESSLHNIFSIVHRSKLAPAFVRWKEYVIHARESIACCSGTEVIEVNCKTEDIELPHYDHSGTCKCVQCMQRYGYFSKTFHNQNQPIPGHLVQQLNESNSSDTHLPYDKHGMCHSTCDLTKSPVAVIDGVTVLRPSKHPRASLVMQSSTGGDNHASIPLSAFSGHSLYRVSSDHPTTYRDPILIVESECSLGDHLHHRLQDVLNVYNKYSSKKKDLLENIPSEKNLVYKMASVIPIRNKKSIKRINTNIRNVKSAHVVNKKKNST